MGPSNAVNKLPWAGETANFILVYPEQVFRMTEGS